MENDEEMLREIEIEREREREREAEKVHLENL